MTNDPRTGEPLLQPQPDFVSRLRVNKMTSVYARGPVPENTGASLTALIAAVCPLHGVSIGRWDDHASWRLDETSEATDEQIDAARAIMATFDPWGDGSVPAEAPVLFDPQPVEDEDPGEQDLGAEMLAAEDEAGETAADESDVPHPGPEEDGGLGEDDAGPEVRTDAGGADADHGHVDLHEGDVAYPGIAILPDELGARRNAVLAAITTEKLTRLSIAMDPSRADFLATRFADYQNAGALGLPIDEALAADYHAFQELRDRRDRITNYAMQLEQSALDGDMDRLSAMHAGLSDGWP